jgi:membrane protein DedA with SNARE-associated domain
MSLLEYVILFVLVVSMGIGVPVLGDASLMAAGTLAGEGRLNLFVVLVIGLVGWMVGSLAGYQIGVHGGRGLLEHPGRLEKRRRKLLAKGDRTFGSRTFLAAVTMPAFVSGVFRIGLRIFLLGALVAGVGFVGMYVGLSYFLGAEIAERIGDAGTKAVIGVLVVVAIGLGIKAGVARLRGRRTPETSREKR